jgi:serine/threonine protein kinase
MRPTRLPLQAEAEDSGGVKKERFVHDLDQRRTKTPADWRSEYVTVATNVSARSAEGHSDGRSSLPAVARDFFDHLLRLRLLQPRSANSFLNTHSEHLSEFSTAERLAGALIQDQLLTRYQIERVMAGTTHGLVLGHYRVLDRLGAGAMGVVFLGEHTLMKRRVAIKVLPVDDDCPSVHLERFYTEMQVLARLHHPNIVMAYDSGTLEPMSAGFPMLLYLVMELVDGCNLEAYVRANGPVPIAKAASWMCQAACGLQEAHNHAVIHRDVKPSNLLLTRNEQIKLVDFGLVQQFATRLTDPSALLGTVEFMAPEQSQDATSVTTQTDIYALGATLFWLLTGEPPYPASRTLRDGLERLQTEAPRHLRDLRPQAPPELDKVLERMLERNPTRRPAMALSVKKLLEPFCLHPD